MLNLKRKIIIKYVLVPKVSGPFCTLPITANTDIA